MMDSSRTFLITFIVAIVIGPVLSTDYIVGDESGWKVGFDYTSWVQGKDFQVGDSIDFVYTPGSHNVLKVNGPDFQKCTSTNASTVPMLSGNDVINLTTPGTKWYICDIANHCSDGMKLAITVSVPYSPTPSPILGSDPTLPSAATQIPPLITCFWMLAIVATFRMIDVDYGLI